MRFFFKEFNELFSWLVKIYSEKFLQVNQPHVQRCLHHFSAGCLQLLRTIWKFLPQQNPSASSPPLLLDVSPSHVFMCEIIWVPGINSLCRFQSLYEETLHVARSMQRQFGSQRKIKVILVTPFLLLLSSWGYINGSSFVSAVKKLRGISTTMRITSFFSFWGNRRVKSALWYYGTNAKIFSSFVKWRKFREMSAMIPTWFVFPVQCKGRALLVAKLLCGQILSVLRVISGTTHFHNEKALDFQTWLILYFLSLVNIVFFLFKVLCSDFQHFVTFIGLYIKY